MRRPCVEQMNDRRPLARTLVAPAELPLGVVTSAIGAPFFPWLMLTRSRGIL